MIDSFNNPRFTWDEDDDEDDVCYEEDEEAADFVIMPGVSLCHQDYPYGFDDDDEESNHEWVMSLWGLEVEESDLED